MGDGCWKASTPADPGDAALTHYAYQAWIRDAANPDAGWARRSRTLLADLVPEISKTELSDLEQHMAQLCLGQRHGTAEAARILGVTRKSAAQALLRAREKLARTLGYLERYRTLLLRELDFGDFPRA
ncbi:MAG: hypothetical protein LBJ11_07740 [Oscillospiraceae bacterium]|jgi:DNA-directed RNA polymerase specialized sigma24 family protein|nr:hypothetical protein [Oscillospiraceae bacterium]